MTLRSTPRLRPLLRQPPRGGRGGRGGRARAAAWLLPLALWLPLALPTARAAQAEPTLSALVRVQALRQGELTRSVDAVGSVHTASGRTLQLSLARAVVVRRVWVRAGQAVRRGQALIEVAGSAADRAAYLHARDALRYARADRRPLRALARKQLATRAQLDAARKAVGDAAAALAAARAQGLGTPVQTLDAPFDGVVDTVPAAPGARLAAGAVALSLAPSAGLQAVVGVDPRQAAQLRPGASVELHAVFDPRLRARATLLAVAARVDPATGRVDAELALPASARWPLPGLAVQARLPLRTWRGWVVPRRAVLRDASGQAYVFQDDHGRARRVDVAIDAEQGERSVIAGPLRPALPLVVLGNYELHDGMALRTRDAASRAAGQPR